MDSVVMQVSCPGCDAVFELPTECAGQVGECTECGTIFEIPTLAELGLEAPAESAPAPEPAAAAAQPEPEAAAEPEAPSGPTIGKGKELDSEIAETTNTIKLSRSSIGMVPDLSGKDDGFKVDIVQKPTAPAFDGKSSNKKVFTKTRTSISKKRIEKQKKEASAASAPAPKKKEKPKKKWWQFWK